MADDKSGNAPAADKPQNPPAGGEQTPSQNADKKEGFVVTFNSKEEYDETMRKAAQAAEAQSRADKQDNGRNNRRMSRQEQRRKIAEPEEMASLEAQEITRAKERITSEILGKKEYHELISSSPELAKVITKEPWLLLDSAEFIDADDLADQVLDYLDDKLDKIKAKGTSEDPNNKQSTENKTEEKPNPQPTNANPGSDAAAVKTEEERKKEELNKLPPQQRIIQSIQSRIQVKK